jgi:hypothetical protein
LQLLLHIERYTLNAYSSQEYFRNFCFVSGRCHDDRQSSVEIQDDFSIIQLTNVGEETKKLL